MEKHQGTIAVRSRCETSGQGGSGTVFMLFFPDKAVAQPDPKPQQQSTSALPSEQLA
jgi:hypothetical protein